MIAPGWRQASGARSVPSGQRHDEISYPQPVITTRVQFKMVQGDLAGASPATTLASPTPAEWRPLRAPGWGKPSLPRKKMNRTLTTRHRCPGLSSRALLCAQGDSRWAKRGARSADLDGEISEWRGYARTGPDTKVSGREALRVVQPCGGYKQGTTGIPAPQAGVFTGRFFR